MQRTFKPTDRGKEVLTENGTRVGTILGVCDGTAHVRPDVDPAAVPGTVDWTDDESVFLFDPDSVARINQQAVRLEPERELLTQR